MKIKYNVNTREDANAIDRKALVAAISQELNTPTRYLGMPTAAYEVGGYRIEKDGTVTGEDNRKLVADLCELHGFKADNEEYDDCPDIDQHHPGRYADPNVPPTEAMLKQAEAWMDGQPEVNANQTESPKSRRRGILDIIVDELNENAEDGEHWERLHSAPQMECGDDRWRNLDGIYASKTPVAADMETESETEVETTPTETAASDNTSGLVIEMPLTGFTPEKLDNLFKLVNAKATLLKAALGADELPIKQTADTLQFPWFWEENILTSEETAAYATLISLLCKTAKEKKRVTAKEKPVEGSPKYAMRCFLLSLGFIGDEYKTARKILLSRLEGNSSWKNGKK